MGDVPLNRGDRFLLIHLNLTVEGSGIATFSVDHITMVLVYVKQLAAFLTGGVVRIRVQQDRVYVVRLDDARRAGVQKGRIDSRSGAANKKHIVHLCSLRSFKIQIKKSVISNPTAASPASPATSSLLLFPGKITF